MHTVTSFLFHTTSSLTILYPRPFIQTIKDCLTEQNGKYTWLGSSLLLIYEGLEPNESFSGVSGEEKETPPKFDVRMVDFAKTYKTEDILRDENLTEIDDGYLFGLQNLLNLLTELPSFMQVQKI